VSRDHSMHLNCLPVPENTSGNVYHIISYHIRVTDCGFIMQKYTGSMAAMKTHANRADSAAEIALKVDYWCFNVRFSC